MPTENQVKLNKITRLAKLGSVPIYEELTALEDKDTELETEIDTLAGKQNMLQDIPMKIDDLSQTLAEVHQAVTHKEDTGEIIIKIDPAKIMGKIGLKGDKGEAGEQGKIGLVGSQGPQGEAGIDGADGRDGKDGKDGINGKDGSPDTPEQVADKLNTLEQVIEKNVIIGLTEEIEKLRTEIRRKPSQMTGMRKVPIVRAINLTDQVDGIVTTYTLPSDTVKVLAVFSSQFPVIFDGANDFSLAGRTLTLNTGVVQSGQTLNCLIEALFYSK